MNAHYVRDMIARGVPDHPFSVSEVLRRQVNKEELEQELERFVEHYNHQRYHEALGNLTPADMYHGRNREITTARTLVKMQTLERRRSLNMGLKVKKEEPIIPAELRESVY